MKSKLAQACISSLFALLFFSCKEDDPAPVNLPENFFTLRVESSFVTSTTDNWVLASASTGEWIAWTTFESGETKVLNGIVPDGDFTLHFLSVPSAAGQKFIMASAFEAVATGSTWVLTQASSAPVTYPRLTVNVTNYTPSANRTFPNAAFTVSSTTGVGGYSGTHSGSAYSHQVDIRRSPADIQVTLYKGGYPYYLRYSDQSIPATININAASEGVMAERMFTMNLPENNEHYVFLEAYNQGDFPFEMSGIYNDDGGSYENLGYDLGFSAYRTRLQCVTDKKSRYFCRISNAVIEQPSLPEFNFTVAQKSLNNLQATSSLPFDFVTTTFSYHSTDVAYWHRVNQPKSIDQKIDFKCQPLPQEIAMKYPFIPAPDQLNAMSITGYQAEDITYPELLEQVAGSGFNIFVADNVYMFQQQMQ